MTEAIALEAVVKRLPELTELALKKADAGLVFKNACKAAAQTARVDASVLRAYVTALSDPEKLEERKAKTAQLAFLFDELPE